jgi:hypothetical protein
MSFSLPRTKGFPLSAKFVYDALKSPQTNLPHESNILFQNVQNAISSIFSKLNRFKNYRELGYWLDANLLPSIAYSGQAQLRTKYNMSSPLHSKYVCGFFFL